MCCYAKEFSSPTDDSLVSLSRPRLVATPIVGSSRHPLNVVKIWRMVARGWAAGTAVFGLMEHRYYLNRICCTASWITCIDTNLRCYLLYFRLDMSCIRPTITLGCPAPFEKT